MHDEQNDPWKVWRGRIEASRTRRDDRVPDWQANVERRIGYARSDSTTVDHLTVTDAAVSVNQDWPLTKAKIAQLYSQTPEVRLSPRLPELQQVVPIFARELNDTIEDAALGQTLEEVLVDVINASGIGGALVYYESRTEPREVPMVDPAIVPPGTPDAIPTTVVNAVVDVRHCVDRISPTDLLVPSDFTGSNYDKARWLGADGRMTWTQALREFAASDTNRGLSEADKEQALGRDKRAGSQSRSLSTDSGQFKDTDVVNYTQLFYWRHYYHPDETSFSALQRLVFVDGIDEPVVNEPYKGQQRGPDGTMRGVIKNPIRVLTLTYVSDDCLPPSDSSISRFGVNELEASRDAMVQQRKHSIPFRWGDTNRISPNTRAKIDQGTFQGFIWTNGPGDRAVGEVARASFPTERYEFDRVIKGELTEQWQVGTNQNGAFATGERSASEAKIVQQNFQTRVGQERDKVMRFFLGIAEVLAGHLALYGTFDLPDQVGVAREALATGFSYSVRADSTVRKDAQQRIDQLKEFFNLTFQTGYINPKPIVQEWAELMALPDDVVIDPTPKPPDPVKVSVSNAVDLRDPMFLSLLMRTHQAPTPEELAAAMKLEASVRMAAPPPVAPGQGDPNAPPGEVERPDVQNADIGTAPRIERRAEDGGA